MMMINKMIYQGTSYLCKKEEENKFFHSTKHNNLHSYAYNNVRNFLCKFICRGTIFDILIFHLHSLLYFRGMNEL